MENQQLIDKVAGYFRDLKRRFIPTAEDRQIQELQVKLLERNSHFLSIHKYLTIEEVRRYMVALPGVVARDEQLLATYEQREKPPGWQMTDPNHHNPDNFRYIVHVINYGNNFVASLRGDPYITDFRELSFSLKKHPVRDLPGFLQRKFISCTLVDELNRGTYLQDDGVCHGFILDVPEKNILAADPGDMGKLPDDQDESTYKRNHAKAIERRNSQTAQDFLTDGVADWYNEVGVNGVGEGGVMRINGIFVITEPVLGIPLYEIGQRFLTHRDRVIEGLKQMHIPAKTLDDYISNLDLENQGNKYSMAPQRYQEALDLSRLLSVPIVYIPQNLHASWYRKYVIS